MSVARSRLLLLSLGGLLAWAAPASAATVNFAYTGAEQTFTVPAGVTSLHVVAIGGHGAAGGRPGGNGGQVTADLAVTPGRTLYVEVGGNGSGVGTGASGFNGGGAGANGCCGADGSNSGAGGGASDVRLIARDQLGTLGSRLLVAGGGGGGGGYGGGAGGASDSNGANGAAAGIIGGGAGSALAPGAGGAGNYNGGPGASGAPGVGGAGGAGNSSGAGGGGGGGFYGGGGGGGGGGVPLSVGGGGTGAGGGGGGSYVLPGVPATFATTAAAPSIAITYVTPGAPVADASTSTIAFPDPQTVGTLSGTVPVRVINNGTADLVLSSVAVDGPNADDFLADAGGCLAPIAPQASCTVRIRFAPHAAGARVATLVVDSNDAAGSLLVGLSGKAAALQAAAPGPQGPAGPRGPAGAQGPAGPAAKVPLVTCRTRKKKTTCTTTLVQLAAGKATLFRSGRVVATGTVSKAGRVKLTARRRLASGTYALRVVKGKSEQRVAVTVRTR